MKSYDIIILGGGPGGYVAAIKAAQKGAKVALIEKETVGGICLNHGCIPTKALLKSVKVLKTIKHATDFGIQIEGSISIDWQKMLKRKNMVVKRLTVGVSGLLKKNNIDVYQGFGNVLSQNQISVNDEVLTFKHLVIATGASPIIPSIPGLKEGLNHGFVMTSRELLNIDHIPQSLLIIGGGVIGVEFATIFAQLGTKVTMIEKEHQILPMIDEDITLEYRKLLKKEGIDIITKAEVKAITNQQAHYLINGELKEINIDKILLSVGMKPNLIGLEALHLEMDKNAIKTDEYLRTSINHVYAIGDCNGKYMLAHVASTEGLIAVDHIFGGTRKMQYDYIPNAVYGDPEVATIGLTEKEAKNRNLDYKVSTFPVMALGKALADHEKDGFIKLITHPKTHEIYGAHILSYHASDLIAEFGVAIELNGTAYHLAHTIHPHPTLSELILEVAHGSIGEPIHL
jgi:dihydrolipoamide dehydrogenase